MHPLLALVMVVLAATVAFIVGRLTAFKTTTTIELDSYDCENNTATVVVSGNAPHWICAYGANGDPPDFPPDDLAVVNAQAGGEIMINNVPHEDNVSQINLCIWSVDLHHTGNECSSSGSSIDSEPQRVLP